jgi:RNA polymerase-binding transcription factor
LGFHLIIGLPAAAPSTRRNRDFGRIIRADESRLLVGVAPAKKSEGFKRLLEARIAETQRTIANSEQEIRAISAREADTADQAAAEYERQALAHKAAVARQALRQLTQALERIRQGTFGECADCGNDIEPKRLEAIPWARYCRKCQEVREHG